MRKSAKKSSKKTSVKKPVRITDTTLRDAHQSSLATRMRIEDMLPIAEQMDSVGFHSLEVWGGDTFDVTPAWSWRGQNGNRVRPVGFDAPELHAYGGQAAKAKLSQLILGQQIQLGTAYRVDRGRLVCDVYFRNRSLKDYFPLYQ